MVFPADNFLKINTPANPTTDTIAISFKKLIKKAIKIAEINADRIRHVIQVPNMPCVPKYTTLNILFHM